MSPSPEQGEACELAGVTLHTHVSIWRQHTLTDGIIMGLLQVLTDHFTRFKVAGGSRCIVFTHARASVDEILNHLKMLEPMCKVRAQGVLVALIGPCVCFCLWLM